SSCIASRTALHMTNTANTAPERRTPTVAGGSGGSEAAALSPDRRFVQTVRWLNRVWNGRRHGVDLRVGVRRGGQRSRLARRSFGRGHRRAAAAAVSMIAGTYLAVESAKRPGCG